ncbi:MAG: hypothetical protein IPO34_13725 [Dehalococcoidia bacterium]|nr:hypothetical protein [Dehalococcoidia bacterium]
MAEDRGAADVRPKPAPCIFRRGWYASAATAGDADQLLRVFLNLLDNAVKFGRPGDKATLALRREPPGVRCAVCDTGPGIAAQHLPFVTQPLLASMRRSRRAAAWGGPGRRDPAPPRQHTVHRESHTRGCHRHLRQLCPAGHDP